MLQAESRWWSWFTPLVVAIREENDGNCPYLTVDMQARTIRSCWSAPNATDWASYLVHEAAHVYYYANNFTAVGCYGEIRAYGFQNAYRATHGFGIIDNEPPIGC